MKRYNRELIIFLALAVSFALMLTACFSKETEDISDSNNNEIQSSDIEEMDPDDPTVKDYDNGIAFEEEQEGAQITVSKKTSADFIGSWESTSGYSHYMFGNIELKILNNGMWSGNITEEKVSGNWIEKDGGIYLSSDLFNCQLNFTKDDKLVMKYVPFEDSTDAIVIVLTEKESLL